MTESDVHLAMKAIIRRELERERYAVVQEPVAPPAKKVSWRAYRPDLMGYKSEGGLEELVLVECETRPNMRRLEKKNASSVWFQTYLNREGQVRRILAVPQGKLGAVDLAVRDVWEVWVIGPKCPLAKLPALRDARDAPGQAK